MFKLIVFALFLPLSSLLLADDAEVRDPTTPLGARIGVAGVNSESGYILDSVLISAQRKFAIINGQTFREGEIIPGSGSVKVQRILPQTVVLQQGEKTWALTMAPTVVKKH